jgi:hypothetical protein
VRKKEKYTVNFVNFVNFKLPGRLLGSDAPTTIVDFFVVPPCTKHDTQITRYLVDNDII